MSKKLLFSGGSCSQPGIKNNRKNMCKINSYYSDKGELLNRPCIYYDYHRHKFVSNDMVALRHHLTVSVSSFYQRCILPQERELLIRKVLQRIIDSTERIVVE